MPKMTYPHFYRVCPLLEFKKINISIIIIIELKIYNGEQLNQMQNEYSITVKLFI